ncbi:MAG TPA: hypothetical protein VFO10_19510 [Oligoflexus sp.]|uniref:hypothetical protein n=1 Tax=Oligoflexus sp. TaxID=1971216 RepID=UPI002D7E39ED|nr:hypothetical protein [Oligoflexus sp.]HET9239459.1 hypothetical protein [Oligoflexus sp.]
MTIKLYSISAVLCLYSCADDSNRVSIEKPGSGSLANSSSEKSIIMNFAVSEALKQKKSLKVYVSVYRNSPETDGVTFSISDPISFDIHSSASSTSKARISFLYFEDDTIKGYTTGLSNSKCPDLDLNPLNDTAIDLKPELFCEIVPE